MADAIDSITLNGPDGLSLTLPDFFAERPQQESAQFPIVAAAQGTPDFAPTLSVRVEEITPELATIAQLGAAVVSRQLALGRLVVAVDAWPVAGHDEGRRLMSLDVDGDDTVLELHYLSVRSGGCVTLSLLTLASAHSFALEVFRYATGTLRCEGSAGPVTPAPKSTLAPESGSGPDDVGASRPATREDLGQIRAAQSFLSASVPLAAEDVKALRASLRRNRRGHDALVAAGLIEGDGQLTPRGATAHALLARSQAQLHAEVTVPGIDGPYVLEAFLRDADVAVLADPAPGQTRSGRTLDVMAGLTLPVTLARWLGLAPAWSFDIAEPAGSSVSVGRRLWEARLTDPHAPVPPGASPALENLWEQPWQVATVRTSQRWKNGRGFLQFLSTPDAGYALVFLEVSRSRPVRLESRSSAQLLHALLIVSGIVDRREPQ